MPVTTLMASIACSVPIMPGTGPNTPASEQRPHASGRGASGNKQRWQGPARPTAKLLHLGVRPARRASPFNHVYTLAIHVKPSARWIHSASETPFIPRRMKMHCQVLESASGHLRLSGR